MAKSGNTIIDNMPEHSSLSVTVRKIDNGYLRNESRCDGKGYSSTETFHPTNPGLGGKASTSGVSGESLKGATAYLKGLK